MNNQTQSAVKRIRNVSRTLQSIFAIFIVVFVVVAIWGAVATLLPVKGMERHISSDGHGEEIVTIKEIYISGPSIFGILTYVVGSFLGTWGLWCIYRLFSFFSKGDIFTKRTVAQLKHLGRVLLLYALFQVWVNLFPLLKLGMGIYDVFISLAQDGLPALIFLILGLMIATMSWVMEEGRKLREDYELTV